MRRIHNPRVTRWPWLFAVGAVISPVLIMAVALAGRHDHRVGALVAMGVIYAIGQTYCVLCLWRAYLATACGRSRDL